MWSDLPVYWQVALVVVVAVVVGLCGVVLVDLMSFARATWRRDKE